jgi:uncharacterized DUF497 family protein
VLLEINKDVYSFTKHAQKRVNSREVSLEEVKEALTNPKGVRVLSENKDGTPRYTVKGKNKIIVVVTKKRERLWLVITLYRLTKGYYDSKNKHRKNKIVKRKRGRKK